MGRDHGQEVGISVGFTPLLKGNIHSAYEIMALKESLLVEKKQKENFLLILNCALSNPVWHAYLLQR